MKDNNYLIMKQILITILSLLTFLSTLVGQDHLDCLENIPPNLIDTNGLKQGEWYEWSYNSIFHIIEVCTLTYINDTIHGRKACFEFDCQIIYESNFKDGKLEGLERYYSSFWKNEIFQEKFYYDGELVYFKRFRYNNLGIHIVYEAYYRNNELYLLIKYDEYRNLKSVKYYNNSVPEIFKPFKFLE